MMSAPPDVLRWTPRSNAGHGDCAITAIALACGVTYEIALSAALGVCTHPLEGMMPTRIIAAIKLMGLRVSKRKKFDIEEDSGILVLESNRDCHAAYLWAGRVLEPENYLAQLWLSAEDYLKHYRYTVKFLIVVESE